MRCLFTNSYQFKDDHVTTTEWKRTISSASTKDTSNKDKKMTSCNGVSLKNIDKRFSMEEWLKLSPDAKESFERIENRLQSVGGFHK